MRGITGACSPCLDSSVSLLARAIVQCMLCFGRLPEASTAILSSIFHGLSGHLNAAVCRMESGTSGTEGIAQPMLLPLGNLPHHSSVRNDVLLVG